MHPLNLMAFPSTNETLNFYDLEIQGTFPNLQLCVYTAVLRTLILLFPNQHRLILINNS